ncbi:2-dehydro-3-deoxygalactonokinase [Hoeflea sp. WL0058]|uniref:2-dehydro-3-deoxygalactonokinase n=1 Tax=Flavimaribacter sediminis TaxID=2865987 RepID=A0AAE2ZJH7_9HYPH|nr:2-dehydro-3-deoxygalactonokinase [Flavimaribacter sediminis]MBW8637376.1 2-dehydro-3-deoxygalactonokinase [Flavimaribacter sediminis]
MTPFYAAADWGTSTFRLWLVSTEGQVIAERNSDQGLAVAATSGFAQILEDHLDALAAPKDLPVMICGMAGARQGWREAPYLSVPAALSDICDNAVEIDGSQRRICILPGVASHDPVTPDVMRGEETSLLGNHADSDTMYLACLPGTHSKWVQIDEGAIVSFSTFMTGELFGLLAKHSILKHAVDGHSQIHRESRYFAEGVKAGYSNPEEITSHLFSIRAGQLLQGRTGQDGYDRLSGLLVGCEIGGARVRFGQTENLRLIASGHLASIYDTAFELLDMPVTTVDAHQAVLDGLGIAARRLFRSHAGSGGGL